MSTEIQILFEIRSMLIMKDTLTEMGINYNEVSDNKLEIERPYHNIVIDSETGQVSLDEENKNEVDLITQQYQVNWYKDRAIREGNHIREEVTTTGEIILHVTR
jgi:hypothetical protein